MERKNIKYVNDDLDDSNSTLDDVIYGHFREMEHYQYDFKQHANISFILGPKMHTTRNDVTSTMAILHYHHLPNKKLMCGYCPQRTDEEMNFFNELLKGEFKVRRFDRGITTIATETEIVTETYSYPSTKCLKYPYGKLISTNDKADI